MIDNWMAHRIRNYIIKNISDKSLKIDKQFIDQNKSLCTAVIYKQWQLGGHIYALRTF